MTDAAGAQVRVCHRQTNGERRAVSHVRDWPHVAFRVQLHQLTYAAKPETRSGVTLRCRVFGMTEALEYVWQEIRADATACTDDPTSAPRPPPDSRTTA